PVPPGPAETLDTVLTRADAGPVPGEVIALIGAIYILSWSGIALWSWLDDQRRSKARGRRRDDSMG
ncbi:MAG: hypothetical protein CMF73_13155, partial [Maricaulis sp.]